MGDTAADRKLFLRGCIALAVFSALPLVYSLLIGAASIPHNDDWSYTRILFHLAETGTIKLVGWNEMVLLGHLLWAYPLVRLFGQSHVVLNVAGAVFWGAGVLLTAGLARRFLPSGRALWTAALLAVFPGYIANSVSYMTDPVSLVAQLGCLLSGIDALGAEGRKRRGLLAFSMVVGLWAFSIREFAAIAPAAVVIGFAATDLRKRRFPGDAVMAGTAFLLAAAVLYLFRQSLPDGGSHSFGTPGVQRVLVLSAQAAFTLAIGIAPAVVWLVTTRTRLLARSLNIGALLGIGAALLALTRSSDIPSCCLGSRGMLFLGNALTEQGSLGNQVLFGNRPTLFSSPHWGALTILAIATGTIALGWLWFSTARWMKEPQEADPARLTLLAWGLGTVVAIVTRAALGGPLFDRYLVAPVVVAAIFVFRTGRRDEPIRPPASALAAFALMTVTSLVLITSAYSFDVARWKAAESFVAEGIPAESIDAGLEWVGLHYEGVANEPVPAVSAREGPYIVQFPAAGNCILVSASPIERESLVLERRFPYATWFGLSTEHLWAYRNLPACEAQGLT